MIQDYRKSRTEFLMAVKTHESLQLHTLLHPQTGPNGEPLYTDIVYSRINPAKPTVIHVSGCHGVEGYLGSTIQSHLLNQLGIAQLNSINLIIVHALNPYGMAWYRRVNDNNVDLNRSFFPDPVRSENVNKGQNFETVRPVLNSKNKVSFYLNILKTILRHGFKTSKQALAGGQYQDSKSLFFGGNENQMEILETMRFLQWLLVEVKEFTVLDIHSGLGRPLQETIMAEAIVNPQLITHLQDAVTNKITTKTGKDNYGVSGALLKAFEHFMPAKKMNYLVQEYGTIGDMSVLYSLVRDQQKFNPKNFDLTLAEQMTKAFYPAHPRDLHKITNKAVHFFNAILSILTLDLSDAPHSGFGKKTNGKDL